MHEIFRQFGINSDEAVVIPFFKGLINQTWRIHVGKGSFILQKINTTVFTSPEGIAANIAMLNEYLRSSQPGYLFVAALPALDGQYLVHTEEGVFRLFPFISDSHTIDVV